MSAVQYVVIGRGVGSVFSSRRCEREERPPRKLSVPKKPIALKN